MSAVSVCVCVCGVPSSGHLAASITQSPTMKENLKKCFSFSWPDLALTVATN